MKRKKIRFTKTLKKKWLAAMRSGKFVQGRGRLRKDGGYCCLGVLGKVAGVSEYALKTKELLHLFPNRECPEYLILNENTQEALAGMNDQERKSFKEIADWVERNLDPNDRQIHPE